jgi:hypothetical protein
VPLRTATFSAENRPIHRIPSMMRVLSDSDGKAHTCLICAMSALERCQNG